MGRPAHIAHNCHLKNQMTHNSWPRRRSSFTSAKIRNIFDSRTGMTASVALLWAIFWVSLSSSAFSHDLDLDSDLTERETGWQFDDTIAVFDNATTNATTTTAAKVSGNQVALTNGGFESCNVTGNGTVTVLITDNTTIPNWQPGGAGVQVIQAAGYHMSSFAKSLFAIHLNVPTAPTNGTQGSIATTLAINPATGKSFTVQFDMARMPDGPINLLSALKVSSISGTTTNSWMLHHVKYNVTDTASSISWQRLSFVYEGTGAATKIQFESMSEKYGPLIDNVVILNGKHPLSAAPSADSHLSLWQRMCPIFTVVVVIAFHCPLSQLTSIL